VETSASGDRVRNLQVFLQRTIQAGRKPTFRFCALLPTNLSGIFFLCSAVIVVVDAPALVRSRQFSCHRSATEEPRRWRSWFLLAGFLGRCPRMACIGPPPLAQAAANLNNVRTPIRLATEAAGLKFGGDFLQSLEKRERQSL